jgi:hypothetical protein
VDTRTAKRPSLHTVDEDEAQQIVTAKSQAERQPILNLQIARAYLAGSDNGMRHLLCDCPPGIRDYVPSHDQAR